MQRWEMELAKTPILRGQIWEVDFEPQAYKEEPAKRHRPALVIQTDKLNKAKHPTTIVIALLSVAHIRRVEQALNQLTT